jgi:glucose-6-phosphate dehydrogenase assembly protein OpcA
MAADPFGALAQRRVADTSATSRPLATLRNVSAHYAPGDTDLAWTRLTPWRTLLAASLDQHPAKVDGATVEAASGNASAPLLASWLSQRLNIDARLVRTGGPGITAVRLNVPTGEIAITRPDGRLARYSVPGQPVRSVALRRREVSELLSEELRRLDPDDIYAETVQEYLARTDESGRRTASNSNAAKSDAGKSSAGKSSAGKSSAAKKTVSKTAASPKSSGPTTSSSKASSSKASSSKAGTSKSGSPNGKKAAGTRKDRS